MRHNLNALVKRRNRDRETKPRHVDHRLGVPECRALPTPRLVPEPEPDIHPGRIRDHDVVQTLDQFVFIELDQPVHPLGRGAGEVERQRAVVAVDGQLAGRAAAINPQTKAAAARHSSNACTSSRGIAASRS